MRPNVMTINPKRPRLCPRCKQPLQIRQHRFLRQKELRARSYFESWGYCTNRACKTTTVVWEKARNRNPEYE